VLPFVARGPKLVTAEEVECAIEFFLVDLVSAGGDLSTSGYFCETAWLSGIDPDDEDSICDSAYEANDFNNSGLHFCNLKLV
jgi:hypothetical protein